MYLQRWVASLQRSDVFATVGCTAVPRRGAHRAPVYPRCYNNPSSGRAKGHRGDRKAPICNRRQGRKALTGEAPRPPSSREGDRPMGGGRSSRAVEGVRGRWKEYVPHALNGVHARCPLEKTFFQLHMLHMHHMPNTHQAYDVFSLFLNYCVIFSANTAPRKTTFPVIPLSPSP